MHRIPNCCRNTNQNNGKSNPTSQTGHSYKSTHNKSRREPAGEVIPTHVQWKWTLTTATRKHSLRMSKKKKRKSLKRDSPRIRHPLTWANILRKSSFNKNTCTPTFTEATAALLETAKTESAKCPLTD